MSTVCEYVPRRQSSSVSRIVCLVEVFLDYGDTPTPPTEPMPMHMLIPRSTTGVLLVRRGGIAADQPLVLRPRIRVLQDTASSLSASM